MLVNATPPSACDESLKPPPPNDDYNILGKWVLLVPRYTLELNCTFEQKIRMAQLKGWVPIRIFNNIFILLYIVAVTMQ